MKKNTTNDIEIVSEYFENYPESFVSCIEELDNITGFLYEDRYYDMDELNSYLEGKDPTFIINRAFYGFDEVNHEGGFNPNRDYFKFNAYGNLVSTDKKDYNHYMTDEIIIEMLDLMDELDTIKNDTVLYDLFKQAKRYAIRKNII